MQTTEGSRGDPTHVASYVPRMVADWLVEGGATRGMELEGTLVFVDVSGFTNLSERLARAGNIGAEELTDTIAACFSALLAVAYGGGGSLLKFGGDALLLLYVGDEHASRAARAAVGMRAALRDLGRLSTSAGSVSLKMSSGLHSGTVQLFLVGGSHRELVVTGPCATATVAMEAAAGAGQIIVSPATAAHLDPAVLGTVSGPGHVLVAAPDGQDVDPGPGRREPRARRRGSARLLQSLPVALRSHLSGGPRDAEHRRVTVAFLRFSGLDERLAEDGLTTTAEALDAMIRGMQEAADRHGVTFLGTDVDASGGKVLLTAGAPTSGGNDEERMLLALRDIAEQPGPIPLQIGVHAGHVFAGDIGPSYRRSYTVMGDAVNLAARVMGRSQVGQILATGEVLDRSRTTFETDQLAPFRVKGKSQPVVAHAVGPVRGSRRRPSSNAHDQLPFVGRDRELELFDAVLREATAGSGQWIEVVGDPGVGKSRLLDAFRVRTRDRPVHELVCELHRASTPYASIRKLLRGLLGTPTDAPAEQAAADLTRIVADRAPWLEPWAPLLAIANGTELPPTPATANLDERFLRPRLHESVIDLLSTLWNGPVLVTVEDVQWMDEASVDVLRAVGQALPDHPWVLCTTRREQDPAVTADVPSTLVRLEPLDRSATETLAMAATDHAPLPPHEMAQLVARSGGNPLFLQELVVAAREVGGVASLPDSIGSLVTARIDRLPPDLRDMVREVSVLGYSFPRGLAAAVLSRGDADQLSELTELLAAEDGIIRFRHAMTRDAAYEGLSFRRRRRLHATVGDRLAGEDPPRPELLSFHYHLAARYEDAWDASLTAGAKAAAIYANEEAATFYRRALDAAARVADLAPVEVARTAERLGDAQLRLGQLAEAEQAYRSAARALRDDVVAWAGVVLKDARVKAQLKRYSSALAAITRALQRLEGYGDAAARSQRAQLLVWYGHLRQEQGRPDDAIIWCRRAIAEAEAVEARDALGHAYRLLDWAYADRGELDRATHSARALELYEELGDLTSQASVLNNLGGFAFWAGRWTDALDLYERAHELDQRVGDVIGAALGRNNIAEIQTDQGHWERAAENFREAERAIRAAGFTSALPLVRSNLARTLARTGDIEAAIELLASAREVADDVGAATEVLEADARLAEVHVLRGRPDEALAVLAEARRRSDARGGVAAQEPLLHRVRGYARLQRGEFAQAREAFEEGCRAARIRDADYELALAQQGLLDLAQVTGELPDPDLAVATRQTLDTLGVERLPQVPLTVVRT